MAAADHGPSIIESLPLWAQIAANLGVFCVAVVAAAFGFMRRLGDRSGLISDNHFDEGGALHKTGDDIKDLALAMNRLAIAAEGVLTILQTREHNEDIEREVNRRLKERAERHDNRLEKGESQL